ncbi:MAG TPA: cobalamin-binding protein [Atribacterota bacterium]|nr:cobalamin-binding protein [Atribacterota bacterium]
MNKRIFISFTILSIFFITVLSVCGKSSDGIYPITLVDDLGSEVIIEKKPGKIVSTAPSNTEIIFALGLEDKLIGRSDFCNYPPDAEKIESIGVMTPLNLEKIISLEPDLILAYGGFGTKDIPKIRELGFKVLVIEAESITEMLHSIEFIATACGIPEKGRELTTSLEERINTVISLHSDIPDIEKPKVFTGSGFETIWSPGSGTIFDELVTLAGGKNITENQQGWVPISSELVIETQPDIIIIPTGSMNPEEVTKMKNDIIKRPGWSGLPAVKNNHIFVVNEDLLYREGPRLVEGLELLYEIFHKIRKE